ncbi:AIPR protein [Rhodococcus opacus]|uniref:AIPR protein n=1 Tax=Rhodococcus opacus TaxID=37919 RepID=A0A1B1KBE2_RHOOP|nr:AIPR family protein [Rhodococcus opacus]ANS29899.1 AIPR protein [Rhodococcus opacus]
MDRILQNYLDTFQSEQSLPKTDKSTTFEHFVNYIVIHELYGDEFNVMDVHTGGGGDLAIDGIAIIVNGKLVSSKSEVADLVELNKYLSAEFVFIQSKTSSSFDGAQIRNFLDGVHEFTTPGGSVRSDLISELTEVFNFIYENIVRFTKGKPSCKVLYACTGKWTNDANLSEKARKGKEAIEDTNLFSDVEFSPLGSAELQDKFLRSRGVPSSEVKFSNRITLPQIPGIKESYFGVIPAPEFIKIVTDSSGRLRKSVFEDNVRDFQDYNVVNQSIQETLQDATNKGRFSVLNNGVTVVARELDTTGDTFHISDYQIVNGCQTSHVLFHEMSELDDSVQIPIKIISTEDEEVITSIISATNSQTQVSAEDLYALGKFQKGIEEHFRTFDDKKALHYERRSNQYSTATGVEKVRIITKAQQIKSFASMFLDEPHKADRYYSDLRANVGSEIFRDDHKYDPYYTSAFALYKIEFLFRNSGIFTDYKPARYQLIMLFRYLAGVDNVSPSNSNKIEKECDVICKALWDDTKASRIFTEATKIVDEALNGTPVNRDIVRTQTFTANIRDAAKELMKARS